MTRKQDLSAGVAAPLFWFFTLVFAAMVLSRFDGFAVQIPAQVHVAMLWISCPLLLLAGAIEGRIDHGERSRGTPLWLTIDSRPIRYTFTLALTYFGLVALAAFDVSLGVVDPRAPAEWPHMQRLLWFLGFSFGMSFANYLAAAGALIPGLRVVTAPFSRLPTALGLGLLMALGLGLSAAAFELLARRTEIRAGVTDAAGRVWQPE
ncbi:hypothetical protein [Nannocystis sp. SCPEA4]|uniref:hypothetical protein n=1 Tax=Nannocystis sp. SCPEA4 TaxID=2996787 RepID=UPI0022706AEF|nr:hypothetical protein [Nannocystis sp. SCPEA4]MCY1061281.1 hypothetical protein [Nannocystis sp. SCPEA4]